MGRLAGSRFPETRMDFQVNRGILLIHVPFTVISPINLTSTAMPLYEMLCHTGPVALW